MSQIAKWWEKDMQKIQGVSGSQRHSVKAHAWILKQAGFPSDKSQAHLGNTEFGSRSP